VGGDFREDRDLMDAQVILGFEGRAYHVRDFYASQVLSMILGGGMSSRLFQEVREKRGLCYSVYAFHWGFSDTGIFGIHAATGQNNLAELVPVIADELQKAGDRILQEELDRARAQYRAGLIMSGESPSSRASQIARQLLLFGRPIPKEELMERLSALTVERLTDLSGRLFSTRPTLAAVGPVGSLTSYESVVGALPSSASSLPHRLAV
jgi:predicted Zn-dependent peptidase